MTKWFRNAVMLVLGLVMASPLVRADAGETSDAPGAITAAIPATSSESADVTLLLDVFVNGRAIGKIGEFTMRRGRLLARPEELQELGFRVPPSRAAAIGELIALSDLPGITWNIDEQRQALYATVFDNSSLLPTLLEPIGRQSSQSHRIIESGTGMTLNYDIINTLANEKFGSTGAFDARAFSPRGIVSSNWLAYAGANQIGSKKNTAVRLDSTYTFADVNSLRRYSLGDFIAGGLAWTRPVRLAGFQIRSDFSMRPDLITFPLPSFAGSAAVPSTVNVLADGNLVASSEVGAGPFEVPQLPVVSGAGTISMTVTNAEGQQVTLSQPFYASTDLLSPGLQSFFAQAGLVRRNWGSRNYDFGKLAGSALYRRGISPKATVEGGFEAASTLAMAGAGAVMQVGNLGVVNFAVAPSINSGHGGVELSAGAQRIGRSLSLGASILSATRGYRDIASVNGDGVTRKQLSAFTSLSLRRFGSAGIAYASVDRDPRPRPLESKTLSAEHSKVLSASYSVQFHHFSIFASEFKSFTGSSGSGGFQVGLTIPLGSRRWIGAGGTSDGNAQFQAQQTAPQIGDWGYEAYVSAGSSNHEFGQVQYKSPVGLFSAGADSNDGEDTFRVEAQGAISFADRAVFPSNIIYDSFAVVDTSPLSHVHVLQENRDVGVTNSSGRLLVPDMRSFDLNHISIAAADLPADTSLSNPSREMRPQDRSGIVIKFPIKVSHGALIRLVDEAGIPLPLGSFATLKATGAVLPVGYDGETYVEDLSAHNELTVERNDGVRCTITFNYQPTAGEIPLIGPLRCEEKKR